MSVVMSTEETYSFLTYLTCFLFNITFKTYLAHYPLNITIKLRFHCVLFLRFFLQEYDTENHTQ